MPLLSGDLGASLSPTPNCLGRNFLHVQNWEAEHSTVYNPNNVPGGADKIGSIAPCQSFSPNSCLTALDNFSYNVVKTWKKNQNKTKTKATFPHNALDARPNSLTLYYLGVHCNRGKKNTYDVICHFFFLPQFYYCDTWRLGCLLVLWSHI